MYKDYKLPSFLDEHQKEGVKWILSRRASYLAHAPGAGKTAQAIVASLLNGDNRQNLFIVPPTLTLNWEREIHKVYDLGDIRKEAWPAVSVISDTAHKENIGWGARFIICPDSMLIKSWVLERLTTTPWGFVAIDEASRFKEALSQRTIALFGGRTAAWQSNGVIRHARHVVALDGSPMPNRAMELWAVTTALSPKTIDHMSQNDFGFRYCGATLNKRGHWEFKRSSNELELNAKLTRDFMHVVTEDKLSHPERLRSLIYMTKDVRSFDQKSWEKKHLSQLKLPELSEAASQGDFARFRRELGINKVEWIANYVRDRLNEKNEAVLLFAWHRDVILALEKALIHFRPCVVLGGTAPEHRERQIAAFQDGSRNLFIGNILSMGRGHNLQRADRIVFAEWSWSDEHNKQAEKRASRRGRDKDKKVKSDYIVCPNSMDEIILSTVFNKITSVKKVIG